MRHRHRGTGLRRRLRWALSLGSAALAAAAGLAVAASTGASAVAASPAWSQATGVKLPTGALTSGAAGLLGVNCTSAGFCVAAGDFEKSTTGGSLPMVVSSAGGSTWAQAQQLKLPKSAAKIAKAAATDVACSSSTSCEVVGRFRYAKAPADNNAFIADLTPAGWTQARTMALPASSATVTNATLNRIACASAGNCGAVGTYVSKNGDLATSAFTEAGGTWSQGVGITPPPDAPASGGRNVQPFGISCPAAGECVVAGKYLSSSGLTKPFLFTSTNGTWDKGFGFTLPPDAKTQAADLNAVSCTSPGNCTAVGNYTGTAGHTAAYSVSETGGTWDTTATQITTIAPADSASPPAFHLYGLSCPAAGDCAAAGFYTNGSHLTSALSDADSSSAWQDGAGVQAPADSSTTTTKASTQLRDVSCWSAWSCVGVGSYVNKPGHQQALVAASA
jgi:hypothetical protein